METRVLLPTSADVFSITGWDLTNGAGDKFKQKLREIFGTYGQGHFIEDAYGFHLNERGIWETDGDRSASFRQFLEDFNGVPFPEFLSKWESRIKETSRGSVGAQYAFVREKYTPKNLVGLYLSVRKTLHDPFSPREQGIYIAKDFYEKNFK